MEERYEKELVAQLSRGSNEAFEKLYHLYYPRVLGVCKHYIKDPEIAMDAVQEVFERIWKERENLAGVENFGGYLYVAAKNGAMSYLKALAKEVDNRAEFERHVYLKVTGQHVDWEKILEHAVESLPPQRRLVFKLAFLQGKRRADIALELQLSIRTVNNHLRLAKRQVKACLSGYRYTY